MKRASSGTLSSMVAAITGGVSEIGEASPASWNEIVNVYLMS